MVTSERIPAECFTPGDYIQEELDARGWTRDHFAALMHWTVRAVEAQIGGEFPITPAVARRLHEVLGPSAFFWMGLQRQYDEWLAATRRRP